MEAPDGSSITASDGETTELAGEAALALVKTGTFIDTNGNGNGSGTSDAGETLLYTFRVTNTGSVPVTLTPGEARSFTASYTLTQADVDNGAGIGDGVENTATAVGRTVSGVAAGREVESEASLSVLTLPAAVTDIAVTKIAGLHSLRRGEQVPFTIRVTNNARSIAKGITAVDTIPVGFRYVEGSATVDAAEMTPEVAGRQVRFENLTVPGGASVEIRLRLLALSTAGPGEHVNLADAIGPDGGKLAPRARAAVEILAEPVFDCGEIVGRVFDDVNRNGYPDTGEPGLAGVRVATVKGWLITTDAHGRFHVACADLPDARIGSNFIMKLDQRTLPTGYRLTTENPRVVRLTAGKTTKLNFGASAGRLVRLDLTDAAFLPGRTELRSDWTPHIDRLLAVLADERSVLELVYRTTGVDQRLAESRIRHVKTILAQRWQNSSRRYSLDIETRMEVAR